MVDSCQLSSPSCRFIRAPPDFVWTAPTSFLLGLRPGMNVHGQSAGSPEALFVEVLSRDRCLGELAPISGVPSMELIDWVQKYGIRDACCVNVGARDGRDDPTEECMLECPTSMPEVCRLC